jgi:hypothetical protein
MLTTVKTMTRRKKRNNASKLRKKLQEMQRKKLREKAVTLFKKENVNTTSTQKIHAKF